MRWALLTIIVLLGCSREPAARGAIVFEQNHMITTEIEVLRRLSPEDLIVTRRGSTSIVDVGVKGRDPQAAAERCNALMQTYVSQRFARLTAPLSAARSSSITSDVRILEPCRPVNGERGAGARPRS